MQTSVDPHLMVATPRNGLLQFGPSIIPAINHHGCMFELNLTMLSNLLLLVLNIYLHELYLVHIAVLKPQITVSRPNVTHIYSIHAPHAYTTHTTHTFNQHNHINNETPFILINCWAKTAGRPRTVWCALYHFQCRILPNLLRRRPLLPYSWWSTKRRCH